MKVTLRDFQLCNNWKLDSEGEVFECCSDHMGQPKFLIDETTNRRYLNESKEVVSFKCFLVMLGTPLAHPLASCVNIPYRIGKLVTCSHFWMGKDDETITGYRFKARVADAGKDVLRIVATPISIVGLEFASVYGLFRPYDGRKLYASIERATYGHFILAPCFQPDPKYHVFGGNIDHKDQF